MISRQNKELRQTHDKILMSGGLFDAMLCLTKSQGFFDQNSAFWSKIQIWSFFGGFLQKSESGDKNDALSPFLEKFTDFQKNVQGRVGTVDQISSGTQTS